MADHGGEVHHGIDAGQGGINGVATAHVAAQELEPLVTVKRQQRFAAVIELVENSHRISDLQEMRGGVRAEIPGAASDENMLKAMLIASKRGLVTGFAWDLSADVTRDTST